MTTPPNTPLTLKDIPIGQLRIAIAAAFAVVITTCTLAYQQGEKSATLGGQEKVIGLSAQLAQAQTQLLLERERRVLAEEQLKGSIGIAASQTQQLSQASAEITALSERANRANKCSFFQEQIVKTEQQIAALKSARQGRLSVWVYGEDRDIEEAKTRAAFQSEFEPLDQRLANYSKQLSDCK